MPRYTVFTHNHPDVYVMDCRLRIEDLLASDPGATLDDVIMRAAFTARGCGVGSKAAPVYAAFDLIGAAMVTANANPLAFQGPISPEAEPYPETRRVVGYQIADGRKNIQGDDEDPSGYASFEVLSYRTAKAAIAGKSHPAGFPHSLDIQPIFEGDVEEPSFVGDVFLSGEGDPPAAEGDPPAQDPSATPTDALGVSPDFTPLWGVGDLPKNDDPTTISSPVLREALALAPQGLIVSLTRDTGGAVEEVLRLFPTIGAAEDFLALSAGIDPDDLQAGRYGVNAPEWMTNPPAPRTDDGDAVLDLLLLMYEDAKEAGRISGARRALRAYCERSQALGVLDGFEGELDDFNLLFASDPALDLAASPIILAGTTTELVIDRAGFQLAITVDEGERLPVGATLRFPDAPYGHAETMATSADHHARDLWVNYVAHKTNPDHGNAAETLDTWTVQFLDEDWEHPAA